MFFFHSLRSTIFHRIISVTLLMVLACGMTGLPISTPLPEKIGRFPCENCPCGCSTAEYCWDKCCCHSDAEKLQWAAENNVQPPAFLIARTRKSLDISLAKRETPPSKPATACSCCSAASAKCATAPVNAADHDSEPELLANTRLIRLEDAASCHGIDLLWSIFSSAVIQTRPPTLASCTPPLLFRFVIGNQQAITIALSPEPPVP
ncbi:putative secreted protein [Rhodopirellula maiorica SM1]|uniref:Putative secreted protein n=1 Tax=Rhodopirellula maiorica SM1 TaxID=1265738 RepID=M5S2V7_9BACT|nr:putative secreted protein [Rhodopirellula maiorica SM1]